MILDNNFYKNKTMTKYLYTEIFPTKAFVRYDSKNIIKHCFNVFTTNKIIENTPYILLDSSVDYQYKDSFVKLINKNNIILNNSNMNRIIVMTPYYSDELIQVHLNCIRKFYNNEDLINIITDELLSN